jgi:hypothetical protein
MSYCRDQIRHRARAHSSKDRQHTRDIRENNSYQSTEYHENDCNHHILFLCEVVSLEAQQEHLVTPWMVVYGQRCNHNKANGKGTDQHPVIAHVSVQRFTLDHNRTGSIESAKISCTSNDHVKNTVSHQRPINDFLDTAELGVN